MTWSVVGRGSYFAGLPSPRDVDVVVVTDEAVSNRELRARTRAIVDAPPGLRLDMHAVRPDELSVFDRAIIAQGTLLDGEDLSGAVRPVTWPEWAFFMTCWFGEQRKRNPTAAASAAVRGILAPTHGATMAMAKHLVVPAVVGTEWEPLTIAALSYRGPQSGFDHPDLDRAGEACLVAAGGEPSFTRYDQGDLVRVRVDLVVYHGVFDAHHQAAALTAPMPPLDRQDGGWAKSPSPDLETGEALCAVARVANEIWWRSPLTGYEQMELHRHEVGTAFPPHVDRLDEVTPSMRGRILDANPEADLELLRTRRTNVVAMVQPADAGGQLQVWPADTSRPPHEPELHPGDIAILDGSLRHGVTRVDAGERVVLVTHTHDG